MHQVKILIVEDEAIIAEDLRFSLEELGYSVVGVANSHEQAMHLLETHRPDFAILDIIIDGAKDGISLAVDIRERYNIPFVFLTSHADKNTVKRAKAARPNGYLIKPFEQEDLFASIEVALSNFSSGREAEPQQEANSEIENLVVKESMFVRDKYAYIKINFDDIHYIKADGNYIKIFTADSHFMIRGALKDTLGVLPEKQFFRIHRSYVVNLKYITAIHPSVLLMGETEIPLNKDLRDELLSLLKTL